MKLDDLKARLLAFAQGCRSSMWQSRDETIRLMEEAAEAITDLEALVGELGEALRPFARANHIVASHGEDGTIRCVLSYPKEPLDTFVLASLHRAKVALAKLEKACGKDQEHG